MATANPTEHFLRRATNVASYYGFAPIEHVLADRVRRSVETCKVSFDRRSLDHAANEFLPVLHSCIEHDVASAEAPALFYHTSSSAPRQKRTVFGLGVMGTARSIAEALIIRTAFTILEDAGAKSVSLRVNSIGDRDSSARFSREIQNYLRKNIDDLPAHCREMMKRDVFSAFEHLHRKEHALRERAPRGMDFLSEGNRRHLMEILSYLENARISYEIDHGLIGHRECYSQTLFEIHGIFGNAKEPSLIARGGRFDEAPRRLYKTNLPGVGILFRLDSDSAAVTPPSTVKCAKIFFIQLGFDAKLKSLAVIETLRRARIPIHQSVCRDKLGSQLALAHELKIPYAIIMGQKEALDGTVIVRNMLTRAQNTVPVTTLPAYLQRTVRTS